MRRKLGLDEILVEAALSERRRIAAMVNVVSRLVHPASEIATSRWVERSFRYLRSSLGVRPIYHHYEQRRDAHVFVSLLPYHLLHAIAHYLRPCGDHRFPLAPTVVRRRRPSPISTNAFPTVAVKPGCSPKALSN